MPLQATSGAASYDAFGGGVPVVPNYIEEVFSTYLYTGNGSTQTITNGIDFTGKGGMALIKRRSSDEHPTLFDTARGDNRFLYTNQTVAEYNITSLSFNSNGFTMNNRGDINYVGETYASWTFRKQPKFFTCGTFTGDGTTNKVITHDLNGTTGCIIVKRTDSTGNWQTWHRTFTTKQTIFLNTTDAVQTYSGADAITVTDNSFTVGTNQIFGNGSGFTYVYYVFAHDAGGFGLTGTDNVISCGSFTTDGSGNATVSLGYEPQWFLEKNSSSAGDNWNLMDTMRGMSLTSVKYLFPNLSSAEASIGLGTGIPTATGLDIRYHSANTTYIYIAIRRGPMKVPTSGTSVFDADTLTPDANLTGTKVTNPFAMDFLINTQRSHAGLASTFVADRLRGGSAVVFTNSTSAESNLGSTYNYKLDYNDGFVDNVAYYNGTVTTPMIYWSFKRAPSFFDVVCYTGNGTSGATQAHNLTVTPELMIIKGRSSTENWGVWCSYTPTKEIYLNLAGSYGSGNDATASATTITLQGMGGTAAINASGQTYVAYLFATCAGVSKVGSYTGTATTKQVDCGFTSGARFVLIKKTSGTGSWYVWDSARGIVSGNDPYLLLNSTAAEVTSTDYIDTYSAGFEISSTAPSEINENGGSFIFLAISQT